MLVSLPSDPCSETDRSPRASELPEAGILRAHLLPNAETGHLEGLTLESRRRAGFVNVQNRRRATPSRHTFAIDRLKKATPAKLNDLLRAYRPRNLLSAIPFNAAPCDVTRTLHCRTTCPDRDAS